MKRKSCIPVVPTELSLKEGDMLFLFALFSGLKPVVNTCRSYRTLSEKRRYVVFIHSLRRVKTLLWYLSFLRNSFCYKEICCFYLLFAPGWNPSLVSVVPTELSLKEEDMLFLSSLCAGLKPVVSICRSYGSLSKRRRYVAYLHSLRRVEIRRYYLSFLWNSFGYNEICCFYLLFSSG